ncbi:hypothetical protein FACS1894152_4710 [Bacilli bacterium]|nr:hypothetical protein FACS1894152_4710 [Bacilli bacterium]
MAIRETKKTEEVFEDYLEETMVKEFREDPNYAAELLQDEFNEYLETGDIQTLLIALRYARKAFGYRKTDVDGKTIYYDLTMVESEPKMVTFKSIVNSLGFDFFIALNNSYVKNA